MDLEKVTAKIRPRKHWEAIDLGIALTQKYAKSLYFIWFIITLPIYLVASAVFYDQAFWVILVFWLLLPLWERPLLHFLSRELFGETLSVKQCVKKFFSLAKIQWFASLTWRRPSFTRSLDLPIIQLEGLSGAQRGSRIKVIHSIGSGPAVWLTILFILTEVAFYFSILALAYILLPAPIAESIDVFEWMTVEADSFVMTFILNTISYLTISFITPFYVACGFSIYLNQRTHLEAWDIELEFKRLAQKLKAKNESHTTRLASWACAGILASIFAFTPAGQLKAENDETNDTAPTELTIDKGEGVATALNDLNKTAPAKEDTSPHQVAKTQIKEILNSQEFNETSQESRLVPVNQEEDEDEVTRSQPSRFWFFLGKIISFVIEFALWVFLALLIIFLIIKYRHLITGIKLPEKQKRERPKQLFGLDMQSETLPDRPWEIARGLCEKGELRQGLSLLLRASLIWYIENTGVLIREGDTELECLRKLKPHGNSKQFSYMRELTDRWRSLAYAHVEPEVSRVVDMCQLWPSTIPASEHSPVSVENNKGGEQLG